MTLKRPFEVLKGSPVHGDHDSPLAKRKRCGPPLQPSLSASPARVKRFKRMLEFEEEAASAQWTSPSASPFAKVLSPIDSDKLAASLEAELKRLQKRRLFMSNDPSPSHQMGGDTTAPATCACPSSPRPKDQPLFTLKQVVMVCQRKLKEREEHLKEEFERVLSTKLAEQYDAFVRFSRDQIEKRYSNKDMSYVS